MRFLKYVGLLTAAFLGGFFIPILRQSPPFQMATIPQVPESLDHLELDPGIHTQIDDYDIWNYAERPKDNPSYSKQRLVEAGDPTEVHSFALDQRTLWAAHKTGVAAINLDTGQITWYGVDDGVPAEPVGGVSATLHGVYIATQRGLARFDSQSRRFKTVVAPSHYSNNHWAMEVDGDNRIWLLQKEGSGSTTTFDGTKWNRFDSGFLGGLTRDIHGKIWLAGSFGGLDGEQLVSSELIEAGIRVQGHGWRLPFIDIRNSLFFLNQDQRIIERTSWPGNGTNAPTSQQHRGRFAVDRLQREIWIADNESERFLKNLTDLSAPRLLMPPRSARKLYEVFTDNDQVSYLGTSDGLYSYDGREWFKIQQPSSTMERNSVAWPKWPMPYRTDFPLYRQISARCIEIKPFVGARQTSGIRYEIIAQGQEFWLHEELPGCEHRKFAFHPPFHYGPHLLLIDYDGFVWASGTHYLYRFDGNEITTITSKDHPLFTNDHIYGFTADSRGNMWIGTEGGLFLFRGGRFVPQPQDVGGVFAIYYDEIRDRLIVSSRWNGFYVKTGDQWRHYKIPFTTNGGHDQMVRSITVDRDGTIWLATNAGAVSFHEERRTWTKFGSEFTNGFITSSDGTIYVDAQPRYVLKPISP